MHGGKPFVRFQGFSLTCVNLVRARASTDVASIGTALPKIHHDLGMSANML
jgi:hypothetical protein